MDLKFHEMHFEATDQLTDSLSSSSSFPLLCMTAEAEAFCAINDKVYLVTWDEAREELGRRLCYSPTTRYAEKHIFYYYITTYSEVSHIKPNSPQLVLRDHPAARVQRCHHDGNVGSVLPGWGVPPVRLPTQP